MLTRNNSNERERVPRLVQTWEGSALSHEALNYKSQDGGLWSTAHGAQSIHLKQGKKCT